MRDAQAGAALSARAKEAVRQNSNELMRATLVALGLTRDRCLTKAIARFVRPASWLSVTSAG